MSSAYSQIKDLIAAWLILTLTSYGYVGAVLLSFTINRLILACFLLPLYFLKLAYDNLATVLWNFPKLLTVNGRNQLAVDAEQYREQADRVAQSQLEGTYRFKEGDVIRVERNGKGWMADLPWTANTEEFTVCGATARYVHLKPSYRGVAQGENTLHRPVVCLHGNPSWSYMWRNVFPTLLERGHEVYAVDWLGHGRSDKIIRAELITFELHMQTLMQFFKSTRIEDATLMLHDWGGCVALCTIPQLPPTSCTSLLLLNSFLLPRLSDMSLHYGLLYAIWFMTTGILDGYTPESVIMGFMTPSISKRDAEGYSAPYRNLPAASKSSMSRFSHMAPATPRAVLRRARDTRVWKVAEGLVGPASFDSLDAQSRLSARDDEVRRFWESGEKARDLEVAVVFGDRDPLLKDYKDVLVGSIHPRLMVGWAPNGIWLNGAGHYPVEEKADAVGQLGVRLAQDHQRKS